MADFRRWFTVLAVIAVMAFAANAQIGVANGSANSLLACNATAAGTPELRPEGYTELAGDIVISCTGGPVLQPGASIPTTNIVVYMAPAVPITSRFLSGNGASEALLIIDEAGANITTGVAGAYGPKATQVLCSTSAQQGNTNTINGSSCNAIVGTDPGTSGGPYEVAVQPSGCSSPYTGCTNAQNVYQGKVGDFGANSVTFYNVPVLPPATSGVTRTFRITNIRVPVPGGNLSGTLQAIISTSPNQVLPVAGTAINIGVVGPSMNASVKQNPAAGFQQCYPQSVSRTANIYFTEGFATSFKTRVVPGGIYNGVPGNSTGNVAWAAEGTNTSPAIQNIPGGLYGGFAANSESGFVFPPLNGSISSTNYTAGLADYGTRLKAIFTNIPAGLTMYVSTTSATVSSSAVVQAAFIAGGTSVASYAVLVGANSGEATPDAIPFSGTAIAPTVTGSDGLGAYALIPNSSGVATAIWEVTNSNPSAIDTLVFSVYISYAATSPTAANPYGTPITVLPLGAPVNNVALSFAPEPSQLGFSTANATQGDTPTPRFAVIKTQGGQWTSIGLCQTTLLYPFVTAAIGFDTGLAIANTSQDPFGTVGQTGSCKLYGYGVTISATQAVTPAQPVVSGCDQIANPLPGTNCFGGPQGNPPSNYIGPGMVGTAMASAIFPTGFQGYVIAVCNFQYAHGYAAVSDLGIRNLWSSYLALELAPYSQGLGSPRTGVQSIEQLVH